jgi:hypothetical protein
LQEIIDVRLARDSLGDERAQLLMEALPEHLRSCRGAILRALQARVVLGAWRIVLLHNRSDL